MRLVFEGVLIENIHDEFLLQDIACLFPSSTSPLSLFVFRKGIRTRYLLFLFQVRYHKYYQWVCFTLFFQAILFYIPRYLWKTWEAGKIKMLVQVKL